MALTDREIQVWNEISDWEDKLLQDEATDFAVLYDKWLERGFNLLPDKTKEQFFSKLDTWLFHLHAMIEGTQAQMDARSRILGAARIFNENIESVPELKNLSIDQLNYLADQQIAKHRLYSVAQGGASGLGGLALLGADLPALLVINMRAVQLTACSYGREVNSPFEMMLALKAFHAGMLPKRMQGAAWAALIRETMDAEEQYFYAGAEDLTSPSWMDQPLKQMLKALMITMLRKKTIQGIPLISIGIGAVNNYQLTRRVSDFAQKYYQYRYLHEKREEQS